MENIQPSGGFAVGKKQKNALLDDGVCEIVEFIQRLSGATFPRVVTAAILKYIFGPLQPPTPEGATGPDPTWMRLAVDIERANFTVDEVPAHLLERGMEIAQQWIRFYDREKPTDSDKQNLKEWRSVYRAFHNTNRLWNNTVADMDSERAAIKFVLQKGGFPTPSR